MSETRGPHVGVLSNAEWVIFWVSRVHGCTALEIRDDDFLFKHFLVIFINPYKKSDRIFTLNQYTDTDGAYKSTGI